jgi:hypothetical protein
MSEETSQCCEEDDFSDFKALLDATPFSQNRTQGRISVSTSSITFSPNYLPSPLPYTYNIKAKHRTLTPHSSVLSLQKRTSKIQKFARLDQFPAHCKNCLRRQKLRGREASNEISFQGGRSGAQFANIQ